MADDKPYIGVDLGGTNIQAGLVTPDGKVGDREKTKTKAKLGEEAVVDRLCGVIEDVLKAEKLKVGDLAGIGIGAPGVVDIKSNTVATAVNLRWKNVPLGEIIEKKLKVPVLVDNDVNVGAWGEYLAGAGRDYGDQIAVFVGTGIGAGLIVNGQIYHGHHQTAGEIGHTILNANGQLGRRSFENLASRTAIVHLLSELIQASHDSKLVDLTNGKLDRIRSKMLAAAYEENDPLTVQVITQAARYVGASVASAVTLLSLSCVVIGGGVTEALGDPWVAEIKRAFREFVFPSQLQEVPVIAGQLGDDAGIIGAALLAKTKLEKK